MDNGKQHQTVSVTLDGPRKEIWIKGAGGKGFRIEVGEGPCGLGLTVTTFVGTPDLTVVGAGHGEFFVCNTFEACQYNGDDYSRAHREWYLNGAEATPHPGDAAHAIARACGWSGVPS